MLPKGTLWRVGESRRFMVHRMRPCRLGLGPGDGGLAKRLADLRSELAKEVTC